MKYSVYKHDDFVEYDAVMTIDSRSVVVEGGSIIFFNVRRTEPQAVFPACKFYVMEVTE